MRPKVHRQNARVIRRILVIVSDDEQVCATFWPANVALKFNDVEVPLLREVSAYSGDWIARVSILVEYECELWARFRITRIESSDCEIRINFNSSLIGRNGTAVLVESSARLEEWREEAKCNEWFEPLRYLAACVPKG